MLDLLSKLVERYTQHTHPDVATTVEQSLIQLSQGIYTEEERFIFELLQNAVDANTTQDKCLEIKILLQKHHLVFMHNGDAFSERDIEGLCDVGNGNKTHDIKKIGYKGIGFKSVFMRSSCVTVKTGDYCFKFDKNYWNNYWDKHWDIKKYGEQDTSKKYLMPWQIIPIETNVPIRLSTKGFNVITYIKIDSEDQLVEKIGKLMKNSQFLLFLRCKDIQMTLMNNGKVISEISKSTKQDIVTLSTNGKTDTKWLLYANDSVEVPESVRKDIANDINTPQKLKDVHSFDLSFALELEKKGRFKQLDESESVIYTYLPTSFKFGNTGFPFLVNANFITDAGRQQLHKDSAWNKLIFSKIPSEYLKWICTISSQYNNYYEVLPLKSYGNDDTLKQCYAENMETAINTIPFIPSQENAKQKLLAKESVMDKMEISQTISKEAFINHINRTYNQQFNTQSIIQYHWKSGKILADYGVFIFDKQKLQTIFSDHEVFRQIDIIYDLQLIEYLWQYCCKYPKEKDELISILSNTKFLVAEDSSIQEPAKLFFPTRYREENEEAANILLLNEELYKQINNEEILLWLKETGVNELSNKTFIKYLCNNSEYITEENAIELGRFLFQVNQKENFIADPDFKYDIHYFKFLTKNKLLKSAAELYLGSYYKPEFDIEAVYEEDIFISEDYVLNDSLIEWKVFLLKMGVSEDISKINGDFPLFDIEYKQRFDYTFFEKIKESSHKYGWISYGGWSLHNFDYRFCASNIHYDTFAFLEESCNYNFSRIIFNRIFTKYQPEDIQDFKAGAIGNTGFYSRYVDSDMLTEVGCKINYFDWIISNKAILPTVQKKNCLAKEIYSNAIPQINEMAGQYLPVLYTDTPISEEWQSWLKLKTYISFEDYLYILTQISTDEEHREENKSKVALIYQRIIESDIFSNSEKVEKIKDFGKEHKILSQDGELRFPCQLSFVSLEGFSTKDQVYIGKNETHQSDLLRLMQLLGVDIITKDSIKPHFKNKCEKIEFREILIHKISALALIASGEKPDKETYTKQKNEILHLLNHTHFYHCSQILLSYGNSDDVMEKHTFGYQNDFYYLGDLRPSNVESLTTPLCNYLGIQGKERELFIILIEDLEGIRQNLGDKGYDISWLKDTESPIVPNKTFSVTLDYHPSPTQNERNLITGFKGEIILYEKLKEMGYSPVCPSISTSEDFDQIVQCKGKIYYCKKNFEKYDIRFTTENGVEMYVEVKATTGNKESQENMPISYNEISMVETYNNDVKKAYIIARIFGIDQDSQDIYIFKGHILN